MSEMHILCGFDVPEFERVVKLQLKAKGYDAVIHTQLTKKGVQNFIANNKNCDTVVLREIINNKKKYTAEEIASLTDKRDVNVIIVLSARHIGSEYVKTLYSAGITNAIFQNGRKDGASAKEIVELIINKRSRAEARRYYGIESQKIELGFIDEETYVGFYRRLHKDDNLLKNYLEVCADLLPKQIGDFTRRLPVNEKEYLAQFEEFHMLLEALKELGVDLRIKRPKKTSIGLKIPQLISVQGENICIEKDDKLADKENSDVVNADMSGGTSEGVSDMESISVDAVAANMEPNHGAEKDPFAGMSMADLLRAASTSGVETVDIGQNHEDSPVTVKSGVSGNEKEAVVHIVDMPQQEGGVSADIAKAALEDVERREKLMAQEALEKERLLEAERNKLAEERRKLEQEKAEQEKDFARQLKQLDKERKAQEKREKQETEKRQREEIRRRRQQERERAKHYEEEEDDDDFELTYYGEKQFSVGFLVMLFILCVFAAGALFLVPYLSQLGLL